MNSASNGRSNGHSPRWQAAAPHVEQPQRLHDARILMYSHDTFGLGHLRRCRAIAHALVDRFKGLHVLIISGPPIDVAFDIHARVDFVKIPSVIKLYNGEYTSIDGHIDTHDTLALRAAIIQYTAQSFRPDIFIVDKEPLGLRGELERTLEVLKQHGCQLVLGLREVMDAPELLAAEWARKDLLAQIDRLYDHIWIYGPGDFWNPFAGLDVPASLPDRLAYTGFLRREAPSLAPAASETEPAQILVTAGGGGDGAGLMRQVMAAYVHDPSLERPTIMVLGPFMSVEDREDLHRRAEATLKISIVDFDSRLETALRDAAAVVSMGGYNTFCEILSFDKRALIIPRVSPRREQLIRAQRGAELGIVDMLHPDAADDPATMARALHALPARPLPSQVGWPLQLDGLDVICDFVEALSLRSPAPAVTTASRAGTLP